jgi:phage tail protein I
MIRDSKYTSAEHLPSSIDKEPIKAIAKTWDETLAEFMNTNTLLLWSSIDTESESVIDHLAYQLHVDDYDSGLPIATKRELVKNSIDIHRHKGTPYAVEKAVQTVYSDSKIAEWFEYGGNPYYFKVTLITAPLTGEADITKLVRAINTAKNVRSWLDGIEFIRRINFNKYFAGWCGVSKKVNIKCDFTNAWRINLNTHVTSYTVESKKTKINVTLDNSVR